MKKEEASCSILIYYYITQQSQNITARMLSEQLIIIHV